MSESAHDDGDGKSDNLLLHGKVRQKFCGNGDEDDEVSNFQDGQHRRRDGGQEKM